MKNRFKKVLIPILCLWLICSGIPVSAAFNHYPYWAMQAAFNNAQASGDQDAILAACEDIAALYASLPDLDASLRVEEVALVAAKIYEERGMYSDALRMYQAYKDCLVVRPGMTSTDDVTERLLFADAFIEAYAYTSPTVYVHADHAADVPYFGAKNEPVAGTYAGMCRTDKGNFDSNLNSGYLLYVTFESETIQSFDWMLPNTNSHYLMELAWNIPDRYTENGAIEYLAKIANGSFDSYIISDLKYLNTLKNCGVLLRFGAEVNVWGVNSAYKHSGRLEEFKQTYIAAFRRIHDLAELHSPGVAMVYSPNDISNMYVSHKDFYPGDNYVDWVGFSSYSSLSNDANGQYASMEDAYYKKGVYENQMIKMMDIVNTYGDRKPILVSECGFLYRSSNSYQTTEHAKKSMELFYTYINMLYPQVKAVFYFNSNYGGNNYCLFGFGSMSDNPELAAAYTNAIRNNRVIADTLANKQSGYTRLETLNEKRNELSLALYAAYPGNPTLQVEYTLDGKTTATANTIPYSCTIPGSLLTPGKHTLEITTRAKASVYTQKFELDVSADGVVRAEKITHTGGNATCTAQAICEVCGLPYGDVNPDSHTPSSAWTTANGQHYHTCLNGCGAKIDVGSCGGGAASCTEQAKCSVCQQYYGGFAEHTPSAVLTSVNGQHFFPCTTAGCTQTFDSAPCVDSDKDHKCDICTTDVGAHKETDGTHLCGYCGKPVSECMDSDKDHKCDVCAADMGVHEAEDGSHVCGYCGGALTECTDEDKDHKCDLCDTEIGAHEADDGTHNCVYCGEALSECADEDKDHKCDICSGDMGVHEAEDGSHSCIYCGEAVSECSDEDKNHKCDICTADTGVHEAEDGSHNCGYCGEALSECVDENKDHKCDICTDDVGVHEAEDGTHVCGYCGETVTANAESEQGTEKDTEQSETSRAQNETAEEPAKPESSADKVNTDSSREHNDSEDSGKNSTLLIGGGAAAAIVLVGGGVIAILRKKKH